MMLVLEAFRLQAVLVELNAETMRVVNSCLRDRNALEDISRCILRIAEGIADLKHAEMSDASLLNSIFRTMEDYCHALSRIVHGQAFASGIKNEFLVKMEEFMSGMERIENGLR